MTLDLGLEAAHVADTADEWYTPRSLFAALGLTFDLDVCSPVDPSRRTCPARAHLTVLDDGLAAPWHGLVWCNPPYSDAGPWADRWRAHGNGLLLVPPARSAWMSKLLAAADAVTLADLEFLRPAGRDTQRWMILLAGLGDEAARAIGRAGPLYLRVPDEMR